MRICVVACHASLAVLVGFAGIWQLVGKKGVTSFGSKFWLALCCDAGRINIIFEVVPSDKIREDIK
jgi:hypothetical protein